MLGPVTQLGTAVSVSGLLKRYGERTAVDGVDLEIPRGEVFALLGGMLAAAALSFRFAL